ncbi:TIGR02530 family flagellar biosynthesis protein [Lentibacillus saliphilus]|uniref:TIGR02530 family flagellar biosynthesis protein n=1 Tax=Lentibacillus saliphilus TaxID=2737028 RepID=UPI001C2F0F48|nr:TIGR02530 family flagellar biosynthesis protein [Lentibacillus saliphilus]
MPLPNTHKRPIKSQGQRRFNDVLIENLDLTISKHAKQRMEERNIKLNAKQWQQMNEKMIEAKQKGVTDSLVFTNDAALIVSTKNNTIVTAMNRDEASSKLFTNINGAILIND